MWENRRRKEICFLFLIAFVLGLVSGCERSGKQEDGVAEQNGIPVAGEQHNELPSSGNTVPPGYVLVLLPQGGSVELPGEWAEWVIVGPGVPRTYAEMSLDFTDAYPVEGERLVLLRANSSPPTTYASVAIDIANAIGGEEAIGQATPEEIAAFSREYEQQARTSAECPTIRRWDGVSREFIAGHPALVTRYTRVGLDGDVAVRNTHLHVDDLDIGFLLAYRVSEAAQWEPVVEYILESIHFPD